MLHFPPCGHRRLGCVRAMGAAGPLAAILGGCGGSSKPGPPVKPIHGPIEQPVIINLYPNQSATRVARHANGPKQRGRIMSSTQQKAGAQQDIKKAAAAAENPHDPQPDELPEDQPSGDAPPPPGKSKVPE